MQIFETTELFQLISSNLSVFDQKRFMDSFRALRYSIDAQIYLFKRYNALRFDHKYHIQDAIIEFYCNLDISYNSALREERGMVCVPILFLRSGSTTVSTRSTSSNANYTDLIYIRPDLF